MLTADNLWFGYDSHPVLRGASVHLARAALVGVLGPNGSGKTTLLKLLAGALRPSAGHVALDGVDVAKMARAELARRIAVVPQETHLAFDYTVLEIALMGRYPHLGPFQLEGPADLAIAREALAATGTVNLEHRQFSTLSGGEKQRVIIATALAQFGSINGDDDAWGHAAASRVLLLDEPTASLDLRYQIEVLELLQRLNTDQGIAMLICTHDLHLAARLCRDVMLLRDGGVLATGPSDEVLTSQNIGATYDVEVDVRRDPRYGVLIAPIGTPAGARPGPPDGPARRGRP